MNDTLEENNVNIIVETLQIRDLTEPPTDTNKIIQLKAERISEKKVMITLWFDGQQYTSAPEPMSILNVARSFKKSETYDELLNIFSGGGDLIDPYRSRVNTFLTNVFDSWNNTPFKKDVNNLGTTKTPNPVFGGQHGEEI